MSIGHSELWLEQFELWEANFYERHFHALTLPICSTEFFSSSIIKVPSYQYTFYWYTPKGISKFYWKTWKIWTFECQKLFFFGGGLIFEHFRQIDNFETPEKNTWRWFGPHFFFPVSFPYWVTVRIKIWRTKVHIFPTFWPPQNSQIDDAQGKFSKKFQTALGTVQNVRSTHGIHQILLETCTFLMVPCWVWYDHYRGRYRHYKSVRIYRPNPVYISGPLWSKNPLQGICIWGYCITLHNVE